MKTSISSRENAQGSAQTPQINLGSQAVLLPHAEEDSKETICAYEEALSIKIYLKEKLTSKSPPEDLWNRILHAVESRHIASTDGKDAQKSNIKFTLG